MERVDGIDFVAKVGIVWRYRYFVAIGTLVFGLIAVYLALTATEIFRAEAVVTEVHDNALSGAAGGLAGQLGGLASLAGVQLGANGNDANAQGVLASRHLIEEFVKSQQLVPVLTANTGKRETLWFAVKRFQEKIVKVHDDPLKGLTSISVDWTDPQVAAKWANGFVALCNDLMRAQALDEATRNVAYLTNQIAQTREVEVQRSLSELIESETKKLMLANGRRDYAFRLVDPAVPPEVRNSPKRTLWVLSGLALGFFFFSALAIVHDAYKRNKAVG